MQASWEKEEDVSDR